LDNLDSFTKELDSMEDLIFEKVEKVIRDVSVSVYIALLEPKSVGGTPKITGWLRGSWVISVDSYTTSTFGSRKNVLPAIKNQSSKFNNFKRKNLLAVNNIYITNPVPYALFVNNGNSRNIGQRFRERAINIGQGVLSLSREIK
jgi:hypothetical protein